jgi:hypothetical protein
MQTIVLVSVCWSAAGCAGTKEPTLQKGEEPVSFTGTVEKIEPLPKYDGNVFPVGTVPMFVLLLKVNTVEQNRSSPVAASHDISFAIHSPSRLLGADDPTGKTFRFRAVWQFAPDKRFSWIEASHVAGPENPPLGKK